MMKKIQLLFLVSTACLTLEIFSVMTPEEELEIFKNAVEERRKADPIRRPTGEEKKAMDDYVWMTEVWERHEQKIRELRADSNNSASSQDTRIKEIRKPTQDELRRARAIYKRSKKSSSPLVKSTGMLAFYFFPMGEPMKKWYPEMKRLMSSDDEIEVGVGVGALVYVLESGSDPQKEALANDEALHGLLPGIKETYSGNTAMMSLFKRIEKAATPYRENGKTTPPTRVKAPSTRSDGEKKFSEEDMVAENIAATPNTRPPSDQPEPAVSYKPQSRNPWLWLGIFLVIILAGAVIHMTRR